MPEIDKNLLLRTLDLCRQFDLAISNLAGSDSVDLRIFFTMAHGYITRRIFQCAELFTNPNALMRLNDCFATEFLKAINGNPHDDWKRAFRVCKTDSNIAAVKEGFVAYLFIGPVATEQCAACMASVHIKRDLRDALAKVTDVDALDYGNVLIFVKEGNLYAESQLRGPALGAVAFSIGELAVNHLNLNVKQWRNDVYQKAYGKAVPDPSPDFAAAYRRTVATEKTPQSTR